MKSIRSIDSTWDEDDLISFDENEGTKHTVVFYANGCKKQFICYSPSMYQGVGTEQILGYCRQLGNIFQNSEIVIPDNEFSLRIKARFKDGLLHNETSWALETAYGPKEPIVKKEWYCQGQKHSYNDCPSIVFPNFTLTWHEMGYENVYRVGKPCVIYPPSIHGYDKVLITIGFNDKKYVTMPLCTQEKITPDELVKYEPKYFDYVDYDKFVDYVAYLKESSKGIKNEA